MKRRQVLTEILALAAAPIALSALGRLGIGDGGLLVEPAFAASPFPKIYPRVNKPGIQLGSYDPYGDFAGYPGVMIEHLFLPWQDVELSTLYVADTYARD